jgi:anthranilate phosphoribosyltransferase
MQQDAAEPTTGAPARQRIPDLAATIKALGGGPRSARDLDDARAFALFAAMLAGDVPALEMGAILVALRIKGESLEETIAFMRALDADVGRLDAPPDCPRPVLLPSYNGARRHPNLTPLLALLLKRYGVPVLVHGPGDEPGDAAAEPRETATDPGNAAAGSRGGGSTFGRVTTLAILRELGIDAALSLADAQRRLAHARIAYVPTAVLAPRLMHLLRYRVRLGMRSCAHSLAKLIDPFHGDSYRVVPVTHPDYLKRMREFLAATHANALLLRGTEGEPFSNPLRQGQMETFADGVGTICADKECGSVQAPPLPAAVDAPTTAAWIAEALAGTTAMPQPIIAQLACCLHATRRDTGMAG